MFSIYMLFLFLNHNIPFNTKSTFYLILLLLLFIVIIIVKIIAITSDDIIPNSRDGTQWFSTSPSKTIPTKTPLDLYFNGDKFMFWWNEMETMEEACGKVSAALDGYFEGIRKRMLSRAIGWYFMLW